jgi:hypothetical protein
MPGFVLIIKIIKKIGLDIEKNYYICIMSYIIIKLIKDLRSEKELPVIILDAQGEVLEYDSMEEAENMRARFEINSDSGHKYRIKKIGENDTTTQN